MGDKSVLISLKDRWWNKILSGEKAEEIRKTMPRQIEAEYDGDTAHFSPALQVFVYLSGTGHVVGHFNCDKIKHWDSAHAEWAYSVGPIPGVSCIMPMSDTDAFERMRKKGCLTDEQIMDYFGDEDFKAYFWSVLNPTEYETPIPLSDFGLNRPPQSWCYTEYTEPRNQPGND